tara:strand:+ start:357 stop:476 length:120 start_codon:yes stop_codon:yes gene_type:complete
MIYKPKQKTLEKLKAYLKTKESIGKKINKTKKSNNGNSI